MRYMYQVYSTMGAEYVSKFYKRKCDADKFAANISYYEVHVFELHLLYGLRKY